MKQVGVVLLCFVGLVGLVLFFWFDRTDDPQKFALHVGRPTPWLSDERDALGFRFEINLLTFGAGSGVLAVMAFWAAWRLGSQGPASVNGQPHGTDDVR